MGYEFSGSEPDPLERVVRGVVTLLGVGSLGVVALILVEFGVFLTREPRTAAEAHAMAHSAPGVLVALIFGVGGFGFAGVLFFTVAYVNRHRLSAATLVSSGLVGLLLLGDFTDPVSAVPLLLVTLGGYALYTDATDSGPFEFVTGVTTLLWFVELLLTAVLLLDFTRLVVRFVPFVVTVRIQQSLGIGASGILAAVGWYRHLERPVPRAPVVLAAAILLGHLPDAIRAALSEYSIVGLDPVGWIRVIVATGAAFTIVAGSFGDLIRDAIGSTDDED